MRKKQLRAPKGDAMKKRVATDTTRSDEEVAQERLQQQRWFQDFTVDYSLWYIANTHQVVDVRQGLVLIHKPTYLPFIVLADYWPAEAEGEEEYSTVYSFYTYELGDDEGVHHALVPADQAADMAPVIFGAAHESYMKLGAVSAQHGDTLRGDFIALVFGQNASPGEGQAEQQPRRILRVRRVEDNAAMNVDSK